MTKNDRAKVIWKSAIERTDSEGVDAVYDGHSVRELNVPNLQILSSHGGKLLDIWLVPGPKVFSAWLKEDGTLYLVSYKRGPWEQILLEGE